MIQHNSGRESNGAGKKRNEIASGRMYRLVFVVAGDIAVMVP